MISRQVKILILPFKVRGKIIQIVTSELSNLYLNLNLMTV